MAASWLPCPSRCSAEVTYQITVVLHTPGFFSKAIRAVQVLRSGAAFLLESMAAALRLAAKSVSREANA